MTGAAIAAANGSAAAAPAARCRAAGDDFSGFRAAAAGRCADAPEKYLLDVGARIMVFAVAAVALDLLVGYGGLISFGHAAFIGLGAYAVGILSAHGIGDALIALPVAIAVSMLFAWLTGIVCLRTHGAYFIMITLAFGQMVYFIATSLAPYGGDNGLTIAARNTIAGLPLFEERPRVLLLHPRLPAGDLRCSAARWSHRASAACCAAPRRMRPAWRRSASTCGASSSSPMSSPAASAASPDFCWQISPSSWLRPTCRGSNPAS